MPKDFDAAAILGALYGDGFAVMRQAFSRDFVERLHAQCLELHQEAISVPGGAVPRGPKRWYVGLQPERIEGFVDIVAHPWFVAVCEAVLGKAYKVVEFAFDIPLPGAANQPWHRDFPGDEDNALGRRLSSLAFNLTTVDTRQEHGPFEIAPGTQWDDLSGAKGGMFPDRDCWERYQSRAQRKLPQRGDISVRTGLTIHRGTANVSDEPRPVLIVGVVAEDVINPNGHRLAITRAYLDRLPPSVREHLHYGLVDAAGPLRQTHMIDGLLEADYG